MGEKKQILKVPQDPRLLKLFREKAGQIVREKRILPPASFEILKQLASKLIQELNTKIPTTRNARKPYSPAPSYACRRAS